MKEKETLQPYLRKLKDIVVKNPLHKELLIATTLVKIGEVLNLIYPTLAAEDIVKKLKEQMPDTAFFFNKVLQNMKLSIAGMHRFAGVERAKLVEKKTPRTILTDYLVKSLNVLNPLLHAPLDLPVTSVDAALVFIDEINTTFAQDRVDKNTITQWLARITPTDEIIPENVHILCEDIRKILTDLANSFGSSPDETRALTALNDRINLSRTKFAIDSAEGAFLNNLLQTIGDSETLVNLDEISKQFNSHIYEEGKKIGLDILKQYLNYLIVKKINRGEMSPAIAHETFHKLSTLFPPDRFPSSEVSFKEYQDYIAKRFRPYEREILEATDRFELGLKNDKYEEMWNTLAKQFQEEFKRFNAAAGLRKALTNIVHIRPMAKKLIGQLDLALSTYILDPDRKNTHLKALKNGLNNANSYRLRHHHRIESQTEKNKNLLDTIETVQTTLTKMGSEAAKCARNRVGEAAKNYFSDPKKETLKILEQTLNQARNVEGYDILTSIAALNRKLETIASVPVTTLLNKLMEHTDIYFASLARLQESLAQARNVAELYDTIRTLQNKKLILADLEKPSLNPIEGMEKTFLHDLNNHLTQHLGENIKAMLAMAKAELANFTTALENRIQTSQNTTERKILEDCRQRFHALSTTYTDKIETFISHQAYSKAIQAYGDFKNDLVEASIEKAEKKSIAATLIGEWLFKPPSLASVRELKEKAQAFSKEIHPTGPSSRP